MRPNLCMRQTPKRKKKEETLLWQNVYSPRLPTSSDQKQISYGLSIGLDNTSLHSHIPLYFFWIKYMKANH